MSTLRSLVLLALAAAVQGLMLVSPMRTAYISRASVAMGLKEIAESCLEEGCSVDMVSDLLDELKAESESLTQRQQALLILIGNLEALNRAPEANKGEIQKLVSAASRSFSVVENFNFPGEPLGYSLKPSKGNELP